ncbi:MAG TPA: TspO/MBR family protein [Devosia sp.]|jgi:tryptophan-rich sensory protein|nr:TspO/MBR family protein [Devosia sp.]
MSSPAIDYRAPRSIGITIAFVALVVIVGGLIGINARPDAWYTSLAKAPWNPPNWVFAPVWFVLYVFIGIAGARTFLHNRSGSTMVLWALQMLLNWAWSPVWFQLHQPWLAFAIIVAVFALILGFIWRSWRADRVSAALFLPYALWVGFASTLNLAVAVLN